MSASEPIPTVEETVVDEKKYKCPYKYGTTPGWRGALPGQNECQGIVSIIRATDTLTARYGCDTCEWSYCADTCCVSHLPELIEVSAPTEGAFVRSLKEATILLEEENKKMIDAEFLALKRAAKAEAAKKWTEGLLQGRIEELKTQLEDSNKDKEWLRTRLEDTKKDKIMNLDDLASSSAETLRKVVRQAAELDKEPHDLDNSLTMDLPDEIREYAKRAGLGLEDLAELVLTVKREDQEHKLHLCAHEHTLRKIEVAHDQAMEKLANSDKIEKRAAKIKLAGIKAGVKIKNKHGVRVGEDRWLALRYVSTNIRTFVCWAAGSASLAYIAYSIAPALLP